MSPCCTLSVVKQAVLECWTFHMARGELLQAAARWWLAEHPKGYHSGTLQGQTWQRGRSAAFYSVIIAVGAWTKRHKLVRRRRDAPRKVEKMSAVAELSCIAKVRLPF